MTWPEIKHSACDQRSTVNFPSNHGMAESAWNLTMFMFCAFIVTEYHTQILCVHHVYHLFSGVIISVTFCHHNITLLLQYWSVYILTCQRNSVFKYLYFLCG